MLVRVPSWSGFLACMKKRTITGSILALVGYVLSPLSWWNDAFVNIPLAYIFAWLISIFYRSLFGPSFVVGYWLTNIIGLVMMHKGICQMVSEKYCEPANRRKRLLHDLLISIGYSVVIILLLKFKIIRPVGEYFSS
jgi:hypothetical protein